MLRFALLLVVALIAFTAIPPSRAAERPSFQFFEPAVTSSERPIEFQLFGEETSDTRPVAFAYRPDIGTAEGVSALEAAADSLPVRLEWRSGGGFRASQFPVVHYQRPDGQWFYQYRATADGLNKAFGKEVASASPLVMGRWELQQVCNGNSCSMQWRWVNGGQ